MKIAIYKSNDTKKIDTIRGGGQNLCQTRNVGLDIIRSFAGAGSLRADRKPVVFPANPAG